MGTEFVEKKRWVFLGLPWTFTKYTVKEDLITINTGFLSTQENDCYMYKVQDVELTTSFWERIFKLGTVVCYTGDTTNPKLLIEHIKNAREVKNFILEMFCYPDSEKLPDFVNTLGEDLKVKGAKHLGLQVEDVKKAAAHLKEIGLVDEMPSISEGRLGRPYFFIKDPDGIFVEIISAG